MSRYFKLTDDTRIHQRWHLRAPVDEQGQEVDPWQFFEGRRLSLPETIRFPVRPAGQSLDFTVASFSIPVVHGRCVQLFERLELQDVQFIPVQVDGHAEPYFILNTLGIIRCIDDARCEEVRYWTPEDQQPDKVGEYRVVAGLRIDSTKVEGARIFRPWGWTVALIISEELKQAMEEEGITGTKVTEV